MNTTPTLINVRQLLGKQLILIDGVMREAGIISQIFLHPVRGKLLGFELQLEGKGATLLVAVDYLLLNAMQIGNEQIIGLSDSFSLVEGFDSGATTYQEFLETEILTENGSCCGRVKEVYFEEGGLQTVYRIKASGWQGVFHRAYFIKAGKSNYYSSRHHRLVLPVATPRFSSLTAVEEYLQLSPPLAFMGERAQNFSRSK